MSEEMRAILESERKEGIQQGIKQSARETAIALLKEEIPIETIARSVKLPIEEVLKLQSSMPKKV